MFAVNRNNKHKKMKTTIKNYREIPDGWKRICEVGLTPAECKLISRATCVGIFDAVKLEGNVTTPTFINPAQIAAARAAAGVSEFASLNQVPGLSEAVKSNTPPRPRRVRNGNGGEVERLLSEILAELKKFNS